VNTLTRNPRYRDLLQRIGQSVHERDEHTKRKDRRNATRARKKLAVLYDEMGLLLYHHLGPLNEFRHKDRMLDVVPATISKQNKGASHDAKN
jgi:hypothetical protein